MLSERIKTALIIALPALIALYLGGLLLKLLALFVFVLINWEFFNFSTKLPQRNRLQLTACSSLSVVGYFLNGMPGIAGGFALGVLLCGIILVSLIEETEHELDYKQIGPAAFFGLAYTGYLGAFMVAATDLPHSNILISWLLSVTILSDTLAYFGGGFFGGAKFAPRISPNKTVSGSICGLVGAVIGSSLVGHYLAMSESWFYLLSLGVLAAVLSQVGDLVKSLAKRIYGVKDSGNILPGHGGVLDRVDSLLFASPVLFLFMG